jgi:tryptophan 2,3-dioxygenase
MIDDDQPPTELEHGARLDFSQAMSYGDYLHLDALLAAQHPLSSNHNEMLFLIIHHVSELWMKLTLHELRAARENVRQDNLPPAFKMTARASRVVEQLIQAWAVLSTLTPS